MTTAPPIDPSTPEAEIAAFVAVIRTALGGHADEQHGPAGGYQWRWSHRGLWKITAGGVLTPEPVLEGPAGSWRIARADRLGAELAVHVLAGAAALPPSSTARRPGLYASASALGDGGRRLPVPVPAGPLDVTLTPDGPRNGDLQAVLGPGGGPAVVNARTGSTFVVAVDAGVLAVVVAEPFAELAPDAPIPARLHPARPDTAGDYSIRAAGGPVHPNQMVVNGPDGRVHPARPVPQSEAPPDRPASRQPGANTGRRPGPHHTGDWPTGDWPAAGRGPGAAYAPRVVDPGPAPARPELAEYTGRALAADPPRIAGSDLPPRGAAAPQVGIDDTGRPGGPVPEYDGNPHRATGE